MKKKRRLPKGWNYILLLIVCLAVVGGIAADHYQEKQKQEKQLAELKKNAVKGVKDLDGKKIGVQIGTTGDIYASDYEGDDAGTVIERYNKGTDAIQALKNGKINCVIIDEQPAKAYTEKDSTLQILKEEGCGVDCSSLTELMLSEACGFTGHEIMFSSNQTPVEDMQKAYELGAYINLDDATMVEFLERVAGVPQEIFCRYNPGGTFQLGESEEGFQVMDKPGDAKYGMTEQQMIDSYKKLMQKGAKQFGIHAFLASNTISDAYYPELAGILFQLAVRVQQATGAHISYINLSGGVGIPYRPEQTENDIMAIGEGVRKKFEEILVPAGMGDVAIFSEMGRFTTGPYGALVSTVIHEKHIYKEYIGLDACAANLMRPAMYGAYHHITVLGKENEPCDHKYDVVGGLCENNDKFAVDRMLPKIDIGDILYIHDTGAHGSAMGYNYNGKLHCAEVLLCEDGSHRLIRRAQTPRDYFATLDFLPFMKPLFED